MLNLWQEIALNFHPEMADFTVQRNAGEEYADHLSTSYPILARRTLGDTLSSLLRPVNLDTTSPGIWFALRTNNPDGEDKDARRWLERATKIMRNAMYDRDANFVRATKEADHCFAAFGNAVISLEMNRARDALLYRAWHLRDVVWCENAEGKIDRIDRKWNPTASQLVSVFKNVSPKVTEKLKDDPYCTVECRHIVISRDNYETKGPKGERYRTPWVSLWIDATNQFVMEEVGSLSRIYIIPRWVTVPGSQYAHSPAVMAALPDARLMQAITLTLLESSEKLADPPMLARKNALRSDANLFSGGMTWVDAEHDGKLEDAIHTLYEPRAGEGLRAGFEIASGVRAMINQAFFLDSLQLPPVGEGGMSPIEVDHRISQWLRQSMPIFEPMEFEYNGALCEDTFELLLRNNAFGPTREIPRSLSGSNIQFKFQSPIHEASDQRKGQKFLEAKSALIQAAELDPSAAHMLDARITLRDVLTGIGVPATWTRDDSEIDKISQAQAARAQMQAALAGAAGAADVAEKLGGAAKNFAGAQAG